MEKEQEKHGWFQIITFKPLLKELCLEKSEFVVGINLDAAYETDGDTYFPTITCDIVNLDDDETHCFDLQNINITNAPSHTEQAIFLFEKIKEREKEKGTQFYNSIGEVIDFFRSIYREARVATGNWEEPVC